MTRPPFRIVVPFCDQWADPDPDGACADACLEGLCAEIDVLDPVQRQIWLVSRYIVDVDNGGHAQFLLNLPDKDARRFPGTIDGLFLLGLDHAAEILARAHARWAKAPRVRPTNQEQKFTDLDDEYSILGMADPADHPQSVFDTYLRENADLFIERAPPTEADRALIELGNPHFHRDGGRKAWLSLVGHESPRVRLKVAQNLLQTDREEALRIAHELRADPRTNPWVMSKVMRLLDRAGF